MALISALSVCFWSIYLSVQYRSLYDLSVLSCFLPACICLSFICHGFRPLLSIYGSFCLVLSYAELGIKSRF